MSSFAAPSILISASKEAVSCDLEGEAVILHAGSGTYFGLDAVGAQIWNLLQEERTFAEVRNYLMAEYDVSAERCEADLTSLLGQMQEQCLIEVRSV